jgi:cold shock CspA family protein
MRTYARTLRNDVESLTPPPRSSSSIGPRVNGRTSMEPPQKRHRGDVEDRGATEEGRRTIPLPSASSSAPRKISLSSNSRRKNAETQQRGDEASKIERLISKAQYTYKYRKSREHQGKVDEYKKLVNAVKHCQCFFMNFEGGCKYNKAELRKTWAHCPYSHSPSLHAGSCNHRGTVKTWKGDRTPGKRFGYIHLEDGNELFFPDRAINKFGAAPKQGQTVTVTWMEAPSKPGDAFVASKVLL